MTQVLSKPSTDRPSAKIKGAPEHVAIIMDGNRRFARKECISTEEGHLRGAKNLFKITESAVTFGIKVLTVYAFSTENWLRSDPELQSLFHIFEHTLKEMLPILLENNIKLSTIGDLAPFPMSLKTLLYEVKEATKDNRGLELVLAINYGGRDDITSAVKSIVKAVVSGNLSETDISEELIGKHLYTARWKDPDLLIRTSGEWRVSNFLLWQISYTEIYIAKTLWPDFSVENFREAIDAYGNRTKRLGV
jgi:undecaprenyl diphosphate synthase